MTTEQVTRQEMAEALRKEADRTEKAMAHLARGLLKLLGLEPTAEMGQTPWLSSSIAKGSLADLDKLCQQNCCSYVCYKLHDPSRGLR